MSRNALAAVAAGAALAGAAASPAMADSIVYVKNHNVWVMAPDGSKQRQVTRDGTAGAPYVSPSQADNGRIAAGKGYAIVVVDRKGKRLSRFVPRNLKDSTGHSTAGQPTRVALSPDAKRIAYMLTSQSCDLTIDCGVRGTIGIVASNGKGGVTQPGTYGGTDPSWITNSRLLFHGGYLSQNRVFDLGSDESWNWFDDSDIHVDADSVASTDLGDGSVSADGRYYAAVRGYDATTHVVWYRVNGSILSGANPGPPTELCATNQDVSIKDPSLAPDGSGIAIEDTDGISVKRGLDDCANPGFDVVVRGGSDPDWGRANP
jgi:hypothetical protein